MIFVSARAPESLSLVITDPTFDFGTVTGDTLSVIFPSGYIAFWSWNRTPAAGQITLTHTFDASGEEVPEHGVYTVIGDLITASGARRVKPLHFTVHPYR